MNNKSSFDQLDQIALLSDEIFCTGTDGGTLIHKVRDLIDGSR